MTPRSPRRNAAHASSGRNSSAEGSPKRNATNDNPAVTVPNAIGQTLEQAVSTVNGAHLRLIFLKLPVTSRTQAGKVVQQSPLGGAQAPQNAQVVVYLGAFKQG